MLVTKQSMRLFMCVTSAMHPKTIEKEDERMGVFCCLFFVP